MGKNKIEKQFKVIKTNRAVFKKLLEKRTYCVIQHDGWPCATCFFFVFPEATNRDWRSVLVFRGDTSLDEINEDLIENSLKPMTDDEVRKRIMQLLKVLQDD